MTTLDDALREACEVAGLKQRGHWWNCPSDLDDDSGPYYEIAHDNPALPAYVASLLVERAWTVPGFYYEALFALKPYAPSIDDIQWSGLATTNFRILAALVALGHWSIEEAREAARD